MTGRHRVSVYEPLLGTVVEVRLVGDPDACVTADDHAVGEIRRLAEVFSVYDDASELCRWRRGEHDAVSDDLRAVLQAAARWQTLGAGAFNPAVGELSERWAEAERSGRQPDSASLRAFAAAIARPRYDVRGEHVRRLGDCSALNFNAIAKGYIVDRAVDAAMSVPGVEGVVVNAGGDLVHRGVGASRVGIENPTTPHDNAPPLTTAHLSNAGMATSGTGRRGFRVGDQWYGHVIDPRDGRPVDHVRQASVVAPSAMHADAIATVVGVLAAVDGCAFVDTLAGGAEFPDAVACLLVDRDAQVFTSAGWSALTASR